MSNDKARLPDKTPDSQRSENDAERSLINRPTDPNRTGADKQVPPGVEPGDLHDPGKQTPNAPPVVNRS